MVSLKLTNSLNTLYYFSILVPLTIFLVYTFPAHGVEIPEATNTPTPILPNCINKPNSTTQNVAPVKGAVYIPVLYATDRKRIASKLDQDGSTIASLHFGYATVSVPIQTKWLQENNPKLKKHLQALGWKYDPSGVAQKPYIEERGYVAESESRNLVKLNTAADFWKSLDAYMEFASDELFVYIHGFASSGNNAIYSTGVLSSHLEAPVICFTWPSLGIVGLKGKIPFLSKNRVAQNFKRDRKIIDDPRVCADMNSMMQKLNKYVNGRKRISIIAHSLGNRLVVGHLNQHTKSPIVFKRLILIAPDVNRDVFANSLDNILSHSEYVVVFTNPADKVLLASSMRDLFIERHKTKKIGKSKGYVPGIEFVNYSAIAQPRGIKYLSLRHYIPFEHLSSLLKSGTPAQSSSIGQHYVLVNRRIIQKTDTPLSAPNAVGLGKISVMRCDLFEAQKTILKLNDQLKLYKQ